MRTPQDSVDVLSALLNGHEKLVDLNKSFKNEGFDLRFVGGCVRDVLIDVTPKDIDLCTDATPDQMVALAEKYNIKYIPTGIQHGTLTFVINNIPYEITTLRVDEETDGRHAVVRYTQSFKEDASRRDFTYNALSVDFNGVVYDYFDGVNDIVNKVTAFIGNYEDRINEDYLRILRFIRFSLRMHSTNSAQPIDFNTDDLYEYVTSDEIIEKVCNLSRERIWSELKKIVINEKKFVLSDQFCDFLSKMICKLAGINYRLYEFTTFSERPLVNIYRPLVGDITPKEMMSIFKISKEEKTELDFYHWCHREIHSKPGNAVIEIKKVNTNIEIFDVFDEYSIYSKFVSYWLNELRLRGIPRDFIEEMDCFCDMNSFPSQRLEFDPVHFNVSGTDLIGFGFKPGKNIGLMLRVMKNIWINSSGVEDTMNKIFKIMFKKFSKSEIYNSTILRIYADDDVYSFEENITKVVDIYGKFNAIHYVNEVMDDEIAFIFASVDDALKFKIAHPEFKYVE